MRPIMMATWKETGDSLWYLGRVLSFQPWIPFPFLNMLLTPGFEVTWKICADQYLTLAGWSWNKYPALVPFLASPCLLELCREYIPPSYR